MYIANIICTKRPYLWQYKDFNGTSWANFDKDTNENIERAFCDPSKMVSDRNFPSLHDQVYTNAFHQPDSFYQSQVVHAV